MTMLSSCPPSPVTSLLLSLFTPALWLPFSLLNHAKHILASVPLHLLFLLPAMLPRQSLQGWLLLGTQVSVHGLNSALPPEVLLLSPDFCHHVLL